MAPGNLIDLLVDDGLADSRGQLVVGFSGGLDSTVLLEALLRAGFAERLKPVHIHHGLHADADAWAEHCSRQAVQRGLTALVERVSLTSGGNLEGRARQLRRQALMRHVGPEDVLLLAHHRDDQAETLLLRLMRSSGARGLSAMKSRQSWQGKTICRPFLGVGRQQLVAAARHWQLSWIEDPANQQVDFNRNFLRHQVLPLLDQRWPDSAAMLTASASVLAEQAGLLDERAWEDFVSCDGDDQSLSLSAWLELSSPRRRNLLYGWLRRRGINAPSVATLQRVERELVTAADDRQPAVVWPEGEWRRFRGRLYLLSKSASLPLEDAVEWRPIVDPVLQWQGLTIQSLAANTDAPDSKPAQSSVWEELALRGPTESVRVQGASGGERLLLRGHHREVSELWRAAGVPPWRRRRLPLFYVGDELVAVAAAGVADDWCPLPGDRVLFLRIEDSAL
ncbi:MAG: tRNA lysidine(34) synthetase TilS [Gammaproteobacteria bacterium HGW-Gammaproteobacteria-14]|nr:MAG: tRNA lysidine(34) synthetase TilS [Gammaproteobacteria bacterium HGW-Gammaproteobacteria-14]